MADLIDSTRAKQAINQASYTAAEDTLIGVLITAVSKAAKKFCRREFDSQTFDELYDGQGFDKLILKQSPIISIARVAAGLATVLEATNISTTVQRASIRLTSTTLILTRVASGATTTNTLTLADADKDTIAELATAITAIANGWSARVPDTTYNEWPSGDLRAPQGAYNAKDVYAGLKLHTDELSGYEIDANRGYLLKSNYGDPMLPPEYDKTFWSPGFQNYRVIYTAGFATVPEDVQEACAVWVAALFKQAFRDPGLAQEQVPGAYSRSDRLTTHGIPAHAKTLLAAYQTNHLS